MSGSTVDPARCPLCGDFNDCGGLAGRANCWCFSQSIPPEVLHTVPAEARGIACVCRFCASSQRALTNALSKMSELLSRR